MYPLVLHKTMTIERWGNFPISRRILMIGNEISRLRDFVEMQSQQNVITETLERAMELTDLTVETSSGNFRKELLRWREMLSFVYREKEHLEEEKSLIEQLYQTLMYFTRESADAY